MLQRYRNGRTNVDDTSSVIEVPYGLSDQPLRGRELLSPEHSMPSALECLGDGLLGRFGLLTRRERADAFHQVVAQAHAESMRLPR